MGERSLRAITDLTGTTVCSTHYKPISGTDSELKFTAQVEGREHGPVLSVREVLRPGEIGRFLSQEPVLGHLTVPQSLDRYLYTVNNPSGTSTRRGRTGGTP